MSREKAKQQDIKSTRCSCEDRIAAVRARDEPLLLRPREAAHVLALSPRKLWTLTNMKEIPSVRIGGCVRYDPQDLRKWIHKQKKHVQAD